MGQNGINYFGNHVGAPQILQGTPNFNVEVSEGMNPPGEFYPATYIPIVESENRLQGSGFVFMPGKVVAFDKQPTNVNGRLIPAGLAAEVNKGIAAHIASATDPAIDRAAAVAQMATYLYGAKSVEFGVRGLDGLPVAADTDVAEYMLDQWIAGNFYGFAADKSGFTDAVGIMRYASLMAPGTDPSNPATFYKHAYDTGGARAFSRWGYIQVPVLEVGARTEAIPVGAAEHRIALWTDGTAVTFTTITPTLVSGVDKFVAPAVAGTPDQYCVIGRTLLFNSKFDIVDAVTYTPRVDTPFTCLKVAATDVAGFGGAELVGNKVGYDIDSNFGQIGASGVNAQKIGEVLDTKRGDNKDLAMVQTWFRDQGLWQEAPGSATDGRNTQLSLVNAPKYVARIAVNFNFWS